jgi:hypothetical protein
MEATWTGRLLEYHTGVRAVSRRVLESLPLEENSDDLLYFVGQKAPETDSLDQ